MSSDKSQKEAKVRVLVADSSRVHSRLLADALKKDPVLEAIPFEAESSELVQTARTLNIQVLVISSNLDEQPSRGIEILRELRMHHRKMRSVVLLGSSRDDVVLEAFRAGAKGLFSKDDPLELLSECVLSVHAGKVWANSHALAIAVDALASAPAIRSANSQGMNTLSKRELQVVTALAEGLTNREIAEQLGLSPHTVKNYLFRIFDKLGVSSRIELLFLALSNQETELTAKRRHLSAENTTYSYSASEFAMLEKSAQAGLPAAQFALAQLHFARGREPKDLVEAYMWHLVASERALQARGQITKLLTAEQIEEAKHKASELLSAVRRHSPAPGDPDSAPVTASLL